MESGSGASLVSMRSRLKDLLTHCPDDADERAAWLEGVLDEVCGGEQPTGDSLTSNLPADESPVDRSPAGELPAVAAHPGGSGASAADRDLLEAIFQANPGGIAVVSGPELICQMANEAYRAITPHPELNPVGQPIEVIWPAKAGQQHRALFEQALGEEASLSLERVAWNYPDGSVRTFTVHIRPIAWRGQLAALLGAWETTQLDAALQEAEAGRRMLEAMMEYIPEGITITSAAGGRVLYTSKYLDGLDASAGRDGSPSGKLPSSRAALGEVIENEELAVDQDGRRVDLLVNAGPIRDAEGRIFAAVVAARDITERKRDDATHRFLSRLAQSIVALNTPEAVVQAVSEQLGRYLGVSRCFISEPGPDYEHHIVRADYHPGLRSLAGPIPEGMLEAQVIRRVRQGKAVVIADVAVDPLTAAYHAQGGSPEGFRAMVMIPWLDGDSGLAGVLGISSGSPRTWRRDELTLVRGVANLARLALENAYLFQDLQEFRQRFELALRSAPIAVFTTDAALRPDWVFNPYGAFPCEIALGSSLDTPDASCSAQPLVALAREVLQSAQGARRELRFEAAGGQVAYHNVTVEPLIDARGRVEGLAVATLETTPLRRMEAEAVQNLAQIEVQRRLIAERELERTRIARELHDGPLQDLIAASFSLVEAIEMGSKALRIAKLRTLQGMLQRQIRDLRRFCNDLRPPVLAPFGLEKTIRSHAENLGELYPELHIELHLQPDRRRLPEVLRMTLYRVYQELMNNVLRHARASTVTVELRLETTQVVLQVEDDGVGFAQPEDWLELARGGHLGLVGVRERVEMVGGKMHLESRQGGGTRVRVAAPRPAPGTTGPLEE